MKRIAVGDLGEFWYGDYKEPFTQLEGGVPGHPQGVLLKATDGSDKLLCAFCGKTYDNLGTHVNRTHRLRVSEYKEEVGLLAKTALVSERVRIGQIRRGLRNRARVAAFSTPGRSYNPRPSLNGHRTLERQNKTGRCYAQVLAVAKTIIQEGRSLTRASLGRHGIGRHTIELYFGSIQEMRAMLGQSAVLPQNSHRGWSDAELLNALRLFAQGYGRTPSVSDLRRYGLPGVRTYIGRWGSFAEACRKAGLIPNLPIPRDDEFEIAVLSGYAATGTYRLASRMVGVRTDTIAKVFDKYGCPYPRGEAASRLRRQWAADMARRLAGIEETTAA